MYWIEIAALIPESRHSFGKALVDRADCEQPWCDLGYPRVLEKRTQ